jgi:hypothetical protein
VIASASVKTPPPEKPMPTVTHLRRTVRAPLEHAFAERCTLYRSQTRLQRRGEAFVQRVRIHYTRRKQRSEQELHAALLCHTSNKRVDTSQTEQVRPGQGFSRSSLHAATTERSARSSSTAQHSTFPTRNTHQVCSAEDRRQQGRADRAPLPTVTRDPRPCRCRALRVGEQAWQLAIDSVRCVAARAAASSLVEGVEADWGERQHTACVCY